MTTNVHKLPFLHTGAPLEQARAAMILIHGRGASAADILSLSEEWPLDGWAFLAPQADNAVWYPQRFLLPVEQNEPWLSAALDRVSDLVAEAQADGIPPERIILAGFSQGACLALEYAIRNPQRYGGVVGFSGGLIGPMGSTWDFGGDLAQTPVFLGCSDQDPWIPAERVVESAGVFQERNAAVTARMYRGMGHVINSDELAWVKQLMETIG